ncbi:MAG: hypothetical protein IJA01_01880 [Firmicutes bacterium]|nr:hypothetical protein [Bacillota bacterium]
MKEKLSKFFSVEGNPKQYATILFLVGVIIVICGISFDNKYDNNITNIGLMVCTTIGGSFATAAIGIFTLKYSGIVKFVRTQAENVLMKDEYISSLSVKKLKKLKARINAKIYNPDVASEEDSLLNHTLESLEPLLAKYYFEEYSIDMKVRVLKSKKDGEEYIEKTITKELFAKPMEKHKKVEIELSELLKGSIGDKEIGGEPAIKVVEFIVGEEQKEIKEVLTPDPMSKKPYKIKYHIVFKHEGDDKIILDEDGCKLVIKFISRVKMNDLVSFNRIAVPCKRFIMRVDFNRIDFDVKYSLYGFYNKDGLYVRNKEDEALKIRCDEWLLPGNGVALYFDINTLKQ